MFSPPVQSFVYGDVLWMVSGLGLRNVPMLAWVWSRAQEVHGFMLVHFLCLFFFLYFGL